MFICELNSTQELLMPANGYIASAIVLFLTGIFGFFLNLFAVILMWNDAQLWTPINLILLNLVFSDLAIAVLGNPWSFASALCYGWLFGETTCKFYGFFMSLLGISSMVTLSILAFERYVMVSQPFANSKLSKKGAILLIILIWLYSIALTCPPFFGWATYMFEAANISCSVNWEERTYNAMTYVIFLFIFGLIVPLTIIGFSYINIIITLKKSNERTQKVSNSEKRITLMVLLMIIAFLIAWLPYAAFAFISQFGAEGIVSPGMGVIPSLIAKSSTCYNPIIYVGLNTQFRQSCSQVIRRLRNYQYSRRTAVAIQLATQSPISE